MKKLTYEQIYAIYSDKIKKCTGSSPSDLYDIHTSEESKSIFMMQSIVDAINESIEQHNAKQYICNECDGCLVWTGVQKTTDPPIDVYKCESCGNIKDYQQKSKLLDNG